MLFCVKARCLIPRIAFQMANHPNVAHLIAGSNNLLMIVAVGDEAGRALHAFENIVTDEASTEALWLVKLIVINLRMRMVVGRIA